MFDLLVLQSGERRSWGGGGRQCDPCKPLFIGSAFHSLSSSLTVKDLKGVIIRLVVNGNTLWLCLGLWGVLVNFFASDPPIKIFGDLMMLTLHFSPQAHTFSSLNICVFFPSSATDSFSVALAAPVGPLLLTLHRPDVSKQVTTIAHRLGFPSENELDLGNVGSWKLTGIPLSQQDMFILLFKKFLFIEKGTLLTFRGSLILSSQ